MKHERKTAHKKCRVILNTLPTLLFLFYAVSWLFGSDQTFLNKLLHRRDYESNAAQSVAVASIFRQSSKSTMLSNQAGKYLITKSRITTRWILPFPPVFVNPAGHIHRNNLQPPSESYPHFSLVFIERM